MARLEIRIEGCIGNEEYNIPPGHYFSVKNEKGEEIDSGTKFDLNKIYGRGNLLTYDGGNYECPACKHARTLK